MVTQKKMTTTIEGRVATEKLVEALEEAGLLAKNEEVELLSPQEVACKILDRLLDITIELKKIREALPKKKKEVPEVLKD